MWRIEWPYVPDPSLLAITLLERQTIEILPLFARQRRDIDRRVKGPGYTHASATRKLILDKNTEERQLRNWKALFPQRRLSVLETLRQVYPKSNKVSKMTSKATSASSQVAGETYAHNHDSDFLEEEDEEGATAARAMAMEDGGSASLGEVAQDMEMKMEDTVEHRSMSKIEGDTLSDGEVEDLLVELEGQTISIALPLR